MFRTVILIIHFWLCIQSGCRSSIEMILFSFGSDGYNREIYLLGCVFLFSNFISKAAWNRYFLLWMNLGLNFLFLSNFVFVNISWKPNSLILVLIIIVFVWRGDLKFYLLPTFFLFLLIFFFWNYLYSWFAASVWLHWQFWLKHGNFFYFIFFLFFPIDFWFWWLLFFCFLFFIKFFLDGTLRASLLFTTHTFGQHINSWPF